VPGDRTRNGLLQQLAASDPGAYARLFQQLEPLPLERGAVLNAAHARTEWVYFVDSGVVSLVAQTRNGNSVEVGLVGREGVAGFADALGRRPLPYRFLVQLPGLAYRTPRTVVSEHIFACTSLHELLMNYAQFLMHQLAQSAVCNRFHTSVQRLARWLLLTAQRGETNSFPLTHEIAAQMVGAPRSAVTQAASSLRDAGAIDYERGQLTIRNVKRLRKTACECFDAVSLSGDRS
jgi:CRP-like cAMP-binding protein